MVNLITKFQGFSSPLQITTALCLALSAMVLGETYRLTTISVQLANATRMCVSHEAQARAELQGVIDMGKGMTDAARAYQP